MISLLYNHQDVRPTKKTYQNKQLHLQLNGKKRYWRCPSPPFWWWNKYLNNKWNARTHAHLYDLITENESWIRDVTNEDSLRVFLYTVLWTSVWSINIPTKLSEYRNTHRIRRSRVWSCQRTYMNPRIHIYRQLMTIRTFWEYIKLASIFHVLRYYPQSFEELQRVYIIPLAIKAAVSDARDWHFD